VDDLDVTDSSEIIKCMPRYDGRAQTGLIWLRIGASGVLL